MNEEERIENRGERRKEEKETESKRVNEGTLRGEGKEKCECLPLFVPPSLSLPPSSLPFLSPYLPLLSASLSFLHSCSSYSFLFLRFPVPLPLPSLSLLTTLYSSFCSSPLFSSISFRRFISLFPLFLSLISPPSSPTLSSIYLPV